MDIDDIRFKLAASRRILARNGCESRVGGSRERACRGRGRVLRHAVRVLRRDRCPTASSRSGSTSTLLEGDWEPSPAIRFHAGFYKRARRELRDPHPLALRVAVRDDPPDDRHVQRRVGAVLRGPGALRGRRDPSRRRSRPDVEGARQPARPAHEEPRRGHRVAVAGARDDRGLHARGGGAVPHRGRGDRRVGVPRSRGAPRVARSTRSTSSRRCGTRTFAGSSGPTPTCGPGWTGRDPPRDRPRCRGGAVRRVWRARLHGRRRRVDARREPTGLLALAHPGRSRRRRVHRVAGTARVGSWGRSGVRGRRRARGGRRRRPPPGAAGRVGGGRGRCRDEGAGPRRDERDAHRAGRPRCHRPTA